MRDYENDIGENNYACYPDYYDLMIKSGVSAYKH